MSDNNLLQKIILYNRAATPYVETVEVKDYILKDLVTGALIGYARRITDPSLERGDPIETLYVDMVLHALANYIIRNYTDENASHIRILDSLLSDVDLDWENRKKYTEKCPGIITEVADFIIEDKEIIKFMFRFGEILARPIAAISMNHFKNSEDIYKILLITGAACGVAMAILQDVYDFMSLNYIKEKTQKANKNV